MPASEDRRDAALVTRIPISHGIRVLIVDDHTLLRHALRILLERQPGIEIVGEAVDGREALSAAEQLHPDVVLMDVRMPGLDGIEATTQIVRRLPRCRVLILTAYIDDRAFLDALRAGAAGYMIKRADIDELLLAIHSIHRGNSYFSSDVAAAVAIDELTLQAKGPEPKAGYALLSGREREVLQLITEGMGNQAIAHTLYISVKTVEAHKAHIMVKLNATNRTDLIRYGIKEGLVSLDLPPMLSDTDAVA